MCSFGGLSLMRRKYLKKIVILFGISMFFLLQPSLSSTHPLKLNETTTIRPPLFSFNSYIDIEYDTSVLEEAIYIEQSVAIPITIRYWTDIPDDFLRFFPESLRSYILFGQTTIPFQTIRLSLESSPSWADIYFSTSQLIVPVPIMSSEYQAESVLYITPGKDAPAVSYKIEIKATCQSLGKLNGYSYQESIVFTPAFTPQIDISVNEQVISVSPSNPKNINIEITNLGNKRALITPILLTFQSQWIPTINPPQVEMDSKESYTFNFQVTPPSDFSGYQTFQLTFDVKVYPFNQNAPSLSYPLDFIFYNL
jgi:hypothetical protein